MSTHWIKTGKVWSNRYHPPIYRPASTAAHAKKKPGWLSQMTGARVRLEKVLNPQLETV